MLLTTGGRFAVSGLGVNHALNRIHATLHLMSRQKT